MAAVISRVRARVFYGWWIAIAGGILQMLLAAMLNQSFGTYAKVLRDEFQWSKTLFSAAFAMGRVETGFLGPLEGVAVDRFGPRTIMRFGIVMTGVGFLLFSQIREPWQFLAAFTMMSIGASFASFMPVSVAIVNWFERNRTRALAIMSLGFAGGGLLVPLVVWLLETFGWRQTAFGSGVLIMAVGLPLSQVVRHRPGAYGLNKDGDPTPSDDDRMGAAQRTRRPRQVDFTARQAMRSPSFWFISLGHASALLIVSALQVHLVLHMTENLGYSLARAGTVVAMLTVMQVGGQAIAGLIGDRVNKRMLCVACMGMHAVGILFLAYATAFWMLLVFVVLHGLAWGTRGPLMGAIRADYFGGTNFGAIMGTSSMVAAFGTTAGPLIAGIIADRTGNYELGFTVLAVLAALGSIFFVLARPPKRPDTADVTTVTEAVEESAAAMPASG
jgi:sugar phosphate permease